MSTSEFDTLNAIKKFMFNIENTSFELFGSGMYKRTRYVKPYSHFFYVFMFVIEGSMRLTLGDKELVLSEGETVLLAPGEIHLPRIEDEATQAGSISFCFSKNNFESGNDLYKKISGVLSCPYHYIKRNQLFFQPLLRCFEAVLSGSKYAIASSFYETITSLIEVLNISNSPDDIEHILQDSDMSRLNKINTIANVYYDKNISVEEMADSLFLSTRQLNRIIQCHYGCSWRELILQKRMSVAADLLLTTEMTVDEISDYLGYNSPRSFYSAFKKFYNQPPGAFKTK